MDPQQRLKLKVAYETFENAALTWKSQKRPIQKFSLLSASLFALDAFDVQAVLPSASNAKEAVKAIYTGLKEKLAGLLSVPMKAIEPDCLVLSYGVDLLILVKLRNWITEYLGGHVRMLELIGSLFMMQLSDLIAKRSRLAPASVLER